MKMNMLTKSIAVVCAVGFFSSASVWAAPGGNPGGGNPGGGNPGGTPITEITPTCTPIAGGIDGVNISWQIPGDTNHLYSYDIILASHTGNTWVYTVANGPGGNKALSHWMLEILKDSPAQCGETQVSSTDPNASIGPDGSTGHTGVKWDSTGGTFTLVTDQNYQAYKVDVLAKSATYYGVCQIIGPHCPEDVEGSNEDYDRGF